MATENDSPSPVTQQPPEAAPGIPAVEVDPSNELLDGENLDEKRRLLQDPVANVQVDPSGRRLEDKDAAAAREAGEEPNLSIPPPAAANLELRKRTEKAVEAMYGSIGALPEETDRTLLGLRAEREGLQRRADDGDERAAKRVGQVDDAIRAREKAAAARRSAAESSDTKTEDPQKTSPVGRSAKPQAKTDR